MAKTLYQSLKEAENLNQVFDYNKEQFQKSLEPFKELGGYVEIISDSEQSFDIDKIQKEQFELYSSNQVLQNAISKDESIEDALLRIKNKFSGNKIYIPHKMDKIHNKTVWDLGYLVESPEHLITTGRFFPDNLISSTVLLLTLPTTIYMGIVLGAYLTGTTGDFDLQTMTTSLDTKVGFAAILGLSFGWFGSKQRTKLLPIEEARYIDNKILELYG